MEVNTSMSKHSRSSFTLIRPQNEVENCLNGLSLQKPPEVKLIAGYIDLNYT